MRVPRVYVDSSVLGGCLDPEFSLWSNRLLADFSAGRLKPVVSDVVAAEMVDAPHAVQVIYALLVTEHAEVLPIVEEALDLAELYQERKILTSKFYNDGLHIALATLANVDILVSWNFRHIVHFDKIRLFNAVNLEYGYKSLQIFSPREVASYDDNGD